MNKAFSIGNHGEKSVIEYFNKNGITAEKEQDKDKKYDHDLVCKLGRTRFTCEVKFDAMASKTRNIAIEHHNCKQDKASGIEVTKADIWIHLLKDDTNITIWAANTKKLKKYIKETKPFKKTTKSGDSNADLFLYKADIILKDVFIQLDKLDSNEMKKAVKKLLS